MPRAIWRGTIGFGLVTVRVRLYPAIRRRTVRFRELDRRTGQRVRHRRVSPEPSPAEPPAPPPPPNAPWGERPLPAPEAAPAREVTRPDLVRGYELGPGRYVEVTEDDLEAIAPERTRTIDVEQFTSGRDLDPIYFDTSYYVVPDRDAVRPFAVLLRAMQETNRAAICRLVLRSRGHLAALQPRDGVMLLTTLHFADEVLSTDRLGPHLPEDLQEREIRMAEVLVDTLAGPWEPERYRDEYREKLLALIEERAATEGMREPPEPEPQPASGVEELMAALQASVEAARARRDAERDGARRGRRRKRA